MVSYIYHFLRPTCFPGSSAGKESTCNAGDRHSIPGWGRSPGGGIGYSLQYSWTSLVTQMLKNPPIIGEIWIQIHGLGRSLEELQVIHLSILAWRISCTEEPGRLQSMGHKELDMDWTTKHSTDSTNIHCSSQYYKFDARQPGLRIKFKSSL